MGTGDDHHDNDECLTIRNNRIFVIDTPGFPNLVLPAPEDMQLRLLSGAVTHVDATDLVGRYSFAEWVIARSRSEGIPWKAISPGPFTYWHSIIWLTRNASRQWVLDRTRSEIARGPLRAAVVNSAPAP